MTTTGIAVLLLIAAVAGALIARRLLTGRFLGPVPKPELELTKPADADPPN